MVEIAGTVSKGWMARAIGVVFDRDYYFDPARRHAIDSKCNVHLRERYGELGLFFTESNLGRLNHWNPRQVLVGGIQPNMIVGMLLGARFIPNERMDADISPTPLEGIEPAELPSPESLLDHELVSLFDQQFRAVQSGAYGVLDPVPPLFWDGSGRPAIHGALTTAQKLFGESIFVELITDPDRCMKVLDWITEVSIVLVDHFARLARREITEVHVGECSACMISPAMFEQFVVPTLSRIGKALGPVRLHSCGTSDHLLAAFGKIENLHSLDVGGGTSVAKIRALFGIELPLAIAPLVDDLSNPSPAGLLAWADRVIGENDGGKLTIAYHLETEYRLDHLRAMHERVAGQDGPGGSR